MKKYILITAITALCIGKINSQVIDPTNLPLSGTQTGDNEYKAVNIQSTQVINSGKTTYTAGNSVVLNPGFEVELGAEFEIIMDDDALNHLTLMTYNLSTNTQAKYYNMHAKVIKACNPDVVAIQELAWKRNFNRIKDSTGYEGTKRCTRGVENLHIAMFWKPELGTPKISKKRMLITQYDGHIRYQAYIIAEFEDFCFIATHISATDKDELINSMLNHEEVIKIKNAGKPIYFAGDMNLEPDDPAMMGKPDSPGTLKNAGFEVLNDMTKKENCNEEEEISCYKYTTSDGGWLKDLILECSINPKRKIIERGIPYAILNNLGWKFSRDTDYYHLYDTVNYNSDHFPYVVKVKIK